MPYLTSKNCVYKKNLDGTKGKLIGCTKGSIKKYLKALYANVKENQNMKKQESLQEMVRRVIKEEKSFLVEGRYPDIEDVISYIVKRKPKDKESIFFFIDRYLKQTGFQYLSPSFEDYQTDISDIVSNISNKLRIDTHDRMSIEDFKAQRKIEPKVGFSWSIDVGAPGIGTVKFTVKKVDNNFVYYSTDSSGVRILSAADVI